MPDEKPPSNKGDVKISVHGAGMGRPDEYGQKSGSARFGDRMDPTIKAYGVASTGVPPKPAPKPPESDSSGR